MAINKIFLFLFFLGTTLSFPLQVYTREPNMPILIYLLFFVVIFIKIIFRRKKLYFQHRQTMISWMVYIYCLYVTLTSIALLIFNGGPIEFLTSIYTFVFPAIVFWYFTNYATSRETNLVIFTIAIAGLLVGIYMVTENYFKLGRGHVFNYSYLAYDYISFRAGGLGIDSSGAYGRIDNVKSFGPLEHASISAAWLAFSYFAVTSWINHNSVFKKYCLLFFFTGLIMFTLNFQTVIAFFIILLLFETYRAFYITNLTGFVVRILLFIVFIIFCYFIYKITVPGEIDYSKNRIGLVAESLGYLYQKQIGGFLLGVIDPSSITVREYDSVIELLILQFNNYLEFYKDNKILLLTGVGFGKYSFGSGSDTGIYFTLSSLGILMFSTIFLSLIILIIISFRQILIEEIYVIKNNYNNSYSANTIKFAVCIIIFVLITELHYSVWYSKGILPIVFFSLSILHNSIIKRKILNNYDKTI